MILQHTLSVLPGPLRVLGKGVVVPIALACICTTSAAPKVTTKEFVAVY